MTFVAERGMWRAAARREIPQEGEGTWALPLDWAGERFEVRYRGMPAAEYAKIEIARVGAPVNSVPAVSHPTRGADSGEFEATVRDPGRYELRIYYEALGRQVRAVMPLTIPP